jgi:hypothetical protein
MSLRRFVNKLKVINKPWSSKKFIGYDLNGNMYFEEPSQRTGICALTRDITTSAFSAV